MSTPFTAPPQPSSSSQHSQIPLEVHSRSENREDESMPDARLSVGDELLEEGQNGTDFVSRQQIEVGGPAWDESDDEAEPQGDEFDNEGDGEEADDDGDDLDEADETVEVFRDYEDSTTADSRWGLFEFFGLSRKRRQRQARQRSFWRFLTNPGTLASLSAPHVSANLFSCSLHPAALLSMPYFFQRTGIALGLTGLIGVAILGGVGGGLWVVLSRYVGGTNVEAITAASFGRHTKWKGRMGKTVAGVLLATYATGAAILAYVALADLLLQIFFHYSPRGIPLHDRSFVTLVIGGLLTLPLLVFPVAKRNLIRLTTFLAVGLYPALIAITLSKVYTLDPLTTKPDETSAALHPYWAKIPHLPNANPFKPPSIWGPFSILPLLTLSSSPLQILAHNRSLRRVGTARSNVRAFMGAQVGQVFFVIGICVAFGIGVGTEGIANRLKVPIHPNLFASLPSDDHLINAARIGFVLLLASHLTLCLVTARSSWGRLLRLFKLNPLRRRVALSTSNEGMSIRRSSSAGVGSDTVLSGRTRVKAKKPPRQWGKLARQSLAGALLWTITASTAYLSGAGGLRRREKEGEEARFVRAAQLFGLLGAVVGFILPCLMWEILFHIRRPRSILPPFATEMGRTATAWLSAPQSMLAKRRLEAAERAKGTEREALLAENSEEALLDAPASSDAIPIRSDTLPSVEQDARGAARNPFADPVTWANEHSRTDRDEETTILLARKERQLQKRTRGRRLWQDILVLAAVLPLGLALVVLGSIDLRYNWQDLV